MAKKKSIAQREPSKCSDCNAEFLYKDGLIKHKSLKHCPALRTHHCSKCPKSFETEDELKEHIEFRHELKEIFCSICQMSFKSNFRLEKHFYSV